MSINWPLALWILGIGFALVLVGFVVVGVIWLGGIIASAIAKDGADTNDGKLEPWLPPPPPPLEMFPPELQAIILRDSIARRELKPSAADPIADMFAVRDGIANSEDEHCPASDDAQHCEAWWDGDQCHWCQAPAMSAEARKALGMEPAATGQDRQAHADMSKLRAALGVHDDGKPVESMRPLDDDRATDGRYQREVLGIWPSAAKPKPRTRYYVSPTLDKADGREVDKAEYVRVERSQGFRNTLGFPDEPATSSFGGKTACGWTVYDTGATRTPWTDPNREVEQADDRGTTEPQTDDEAFATEGERLNRIPRPRGAAE